ncbi:PLC-like phosphodiesterase [Trichodelitschia bisporula]|uniref:PLC-like phosphodiesterase n=1 Tax=Trichodelitschia bisporula TaxID=703511 RepID=A0A6G1HSY9_9PEZI|nr:PLC-like phosphodiesterase [Trichodelitschia bisporula]
MAYLATLFLIISSIPAVYPQSIKTTAATLVGDDTLLTDVTYITPSTTTLFHYDTRTTPWLEHGSPTPACNGWPEFCSRRFSDITHVGAHNFAFARKHNGASNQALSVADQLNDGIRMLQAQVHFHNNTLTLCHTSCHLLNVGPLENHLELIRAWIAEHPNDVVTLLLGNADRVPPQTFLEPFERTGLMQHVFRPPQVPLPRDSWPTLQKMIQRGEQLVVVLDYGADQTQESWLLDEFTHIWETPFSPTNASFPCTVERPPGLDPKADDRMYIANHNLNTQINLLGTSLLIPNRVAINQTNGMAGKGSAGAAVEECTAAWHRPPNFLLVDFYDSGSRPGSVFHVAARVNGVKYTRRCCGKAKAAASQAGSSLAVVVLAFVCAFLT